MPSTPAAKPSYDSLHRLDPQAVSEAFDVYFPQIFLFVRFRIGDDAIAEDIASETFTRLLEAMHKGRAPEENLRAWLYATASHIVTDFHRRDYRHPMDELEDDLMDNGSPSVEISAEQNEQNQWLRKGLIKLTSEQQSVLALRFGQGLSIEETARAMNKNTNAIKQLQFRALAALNRLLGEMS